MRAHECEIRTLWAAPDDKAVAFCQAVPVLFYLTFEALTDIAASDDAWLALNDNLAYLLWDDEQEEYAITLTVPLAAPISVGCQRAGGSP